MNSLWKKESSPSGSTYINIFDGIDEDVIWDVIFNEFKRFNVESTEKSDKLSTEFRIRGNKKFKENKWREAMELYNRSVCLAEIESKGSETMSLAYANRSACFFELKMYEKCLVDIDLAIKANYPKPLMPKLEKRRVDCLGNVAKAGGSVEFVPKLSFLADENFPEMANILKIESNDGFGRFFVAKTDIDVGKTVLIDKVFASNMRTAKLTFCETCLKQTMNFIPCQHCTDEMFCNNNCMERHNFHSFVEHEGKFNKSLKHEFQWLFTAIEIFPSAEKLIEFVENALKENVQQVPQSTTSMMSKLRAFFQLHIYIPPKNEKLLLSIAVAAYREIHQLKSMKEIFGKEGHMHFLMHLIVYHKFVFCNSFTRTNDCSLFITSSYVNHSCAPNLSFSDCGNMRIGTVLRPIKKGQQVFVTYLGEERRAGPTFLRQSYLNQEFGFQCRCEKCEKFDFYPHVSFLLRNPDYRFTEREIVKEPITKKQSFALREKCIELLNKFGDRQWHLELENVAKAYRILTNEIYN